MSGWTSRRDPDYVESPEDAEQREAERDRKLCKIENTIYEEVTGVYYADHRAAWLALVMAGRDSIQFELAVRREAIETYNIIQNF